MVIELTGIEWVLDDPGGLEWVLGGGDGKTWGTDEYVPTRRTDIEEYAGPYEAFALFSNQVFGTAEKVMRDDFTVHAINYTEAPNEYGTTVTIGG